MLRSQHDSSNLILLKIFFGGFLQKEIIFCYRLLCDPYCDVLLNPQTYSHPVFIYFSCFPFIQFSSSEKNEKSKEADETNSESFRVGIVGLAGSSAEEESFLDGADSFCAQLQPEVGIKPLKSSTQKLVKRRCLDRIGRLIRSRLRFVFKNEIIRHDFTWIIF